MFLAVRLEMDGQERVVLNFTNWVDKIKSEQLSAKRRTVESELSPLAAKLQSSDTNKPGIRIHRVTY